MKKNDDVYVNHILDAIAQIESYLAGVTYKQFLQKRLLQDGVIRQLEIIGQASRNLSADFREQTPNIPWRQIIGLRNRVIHAYFDINLDIIWEVVQDDLPPLKSNLKRLS